MNTPPVPNPIPALPLEAPASAWSPLSNPVFRMLWLAWLTANVCMWMNDVAAAWLMTSLSTSPAMVALVQAASTLPVFLFGVPSGALADIIDRRRYFIATQFWAASVAVVLCFTTLTGTLNAPLLLALTFANGIGLAMRWPVFAALIPELVPRAQLPAAVALNGISMNGSRIIGPIVAGAILAAAGSPYVFMLNAVVSIALGGILLRWKREQKVSALPSERFFGAIRVGLQFVRQSPVLRAVLLRTAAFFVTTTALMALLPLLAKRMPGGDAQTFTLMLAVMGVGAIIAVISLPRLRYFMTRDQLVMTGTLTHCGATLAVALAPSFYIAAPAMFIAGMAWISVANSLTVAAQMALPDWVKARGMSVHQMSMMGGSALGAALWGQVATLTDLTTSLALAAASGAGLLLFTRRFKVGDRADEDLTPAGLWKEPDVAIPIDREQGPVLVTVEYHVDADRAEEFVALMRESRRVWLGNGVLAWELFHDTADPSRYIEYFIDESWVEYVRRNDRVTATHVALRERKFDLHSGDAPPLVSRYIAVPVFGK